MSPQDYLLAFYGLIIVALVLVCARLFIARKRLLVRVGRGAGGVDPWRLQRTLMQASDQTLPGKPCITKTTLLYWALCQEELGEMTEALADVVAHSTLARGTAASIPGEVALDSLGMLRSMADRHARVAKKMRTFLIGVPDIRVTMTEREAVALLDGTTDLAVVNSGFCLAAGLPGSEAYLEVLTSNLSKRNDKGTIDKDGGGKWIKGPNYTAPNLASVLHAMPRP